jgi:hypothetical protein
MNSELIFQGMKLTQWSVDDVVARQVLIRKYRWPLKVLLDRSA